MPQSCPTNTPQQQDGQIQPIDGQLQPKLWAGQTMGDEDWQDDSVIDNSLMDGADVPMVGVGVIGPPPTATAQPPSASAFDNLDPLPYTATNGGGEAQNIASFFGFSRIWGTGYGQGAASPVVDTTPVIASPLPLPMGKEDDNQPPGMVRSNSGSLSSETSDGDETMSSEEDDLSEGGNSLANDDILTDQGANNIILPPPPKGVSFNEQVRVLPIPPITAYTDEQRYRMYANRFELRENKLRNKREYEFDGYDWRNATEEHSMAICPMSGELLHPSHL